MEQLHLEELIKYVALYLRKSRGEGEEDLDKHKIVLVNMCKKNNWKYVEYPEIETGESIEVRPVFQRLMKDLEEGLFDAVAVVDIDRLGRGDKGDQDKIQKLFEKTKTLIATPTKIYNPCNDDDEFIIDMKSFMARREYKMITKRLAQGKKIGFLRGDWSNGKPPYPYEYERYGDKYNEKGLVINDEKYKIYRFMVDSVINNQMGTNNIAWELNKKQIPSPSGGIWHGGTVYRILVDEVHLGKIISNKTQGSGHKKKKSNAKEYKVNSKKDWVVVENCHEACKTQEEHEKIMLFLKRVNRVPRRTTQQHILPLSNIIKCGLCGHTMQIYNRTDRKSYDSMKPCWYRDKFGNKCPNGGMVLNSLYDEIEDAIVEYEKQLISEIENSESKNDDNIKIQNEIDIVLGQIAKKEIAIERVQDAFEDGTYNKQEYLTRKNKHEIELDKLRTELEVCQIKLKHTDKSTSKDKLANIQTVKKLLNDRDKLTPKQLNKVYKSIIENIEWIKTDEQFCTKINFY